MTDDQNVPPASGVDPPDGPPPDARPTTPPAGAHPPPPTAPQTPAASQAPAAPQAPAPPQAPAASQAPAAPTPPQAPSAPQVSAGIGQPADLVTRFLAKLIDGVLLGVAYGILVSFLLVGLVFGTMTGGTSSGYIAGAISTVVSTALLVGYFALMESSRGQTVGKMLMKIEVRGPDGRKPTMEQAVKRNAYLAVGLIGIIPILGGLLAPLLSLAATIAIAVTINNNAATRQGWHDLFADGTSVIKIG